MTVRERGGSTVALVVFGALVVLMLAIVVPVHHDMSVRAAVTPPIVAAMKVAGAMARRREADGRWETVGSERDVAGLSVPRDGVVRIAFDAPESVHGRWAEVRVVEIEGAPHLACSAPGIEPGRLPAWCRPGARPRPVNEKNGDG